MESLSTQDATGPRVQSCTFQSGHDECHAWLYQPGTDDQNHPFILMAHGLGGVKRLGLDRFAERFSAAGYGCLVFDYRYFGESGGEPRGLVDIPSQLADWRAALEFARSIPGADPERMVLWGTSFAGGHVLVTAARHPWIAAVIAQCPFMDGLASIRAVDWKTNARVTALALCDRLAATFRREPVQLSLVGSPGSTALMTAPAAVAGYQALKDASGIGDASDKVAARIALQLPSYRPGKRVQQVRSPVLFCVCDRDSVAPARATLRYAAEAPKGETVHYDAEHFDLYLGEAFERNMRAQLAFLDRHVAIPLTKHPTRLNCYSH